MRRLFTTILLTFVFLFSYSTSVLALTASPSSGQVSPNSEQTIAILAAPPGDNVGAAKLRLNVFGATIVPGSVSFESSESNGYLTIGVCEGQTRYTDDSVCVDMAKSSGVVASGDLLVQFRIKFDEFGLAGKVTIDASGSGYSTGTTFTPVTNSNLAEFDIVANNSPAPTDLPITGIEDYPGLVLLLGVATVALGIGFFVWRNQEQEITA